MDAKLVRPQFNISLFNKTVHVTMNQCFVELFQRFVNCDSEARIDWSDVLNGLKVAINKGYYASDDENPEYTISKFHNTVTLSMELDMADSLARLILSSAFEICQANPTLDFSAFIAFGRRLETAARGDYAGLQLHSTPLRRFTGFSTNRSFKPQRIS